MTPDLPRRRPIATAFVTRLAWVAGVMCCVATVPSPSRSQGVRPWVPPSADSLIHWSTEAKARFRTNTGDSVMGSNQKAYELVGQMGRRLLRSLGKANMNQALAIEPVLDSLGLDTDVAVDPDQPGFVLLMVRNPYRLTAAAAGYLYWYRVDDLRMQGAQFSGGLEPQMRVWWTNREEAPYGWAVVDRARGDRAKLQLTVLRLLPNGSRWRIDQYGEGGDLGDGSRVAWADVDGDLTPEIVVWSRAPEDSMFELCQDCPKVINELLLVERREGFRLHDTRILPSPVSTFILFVRSLTDQNRAVAARLLKEPAKVDGAIQAGWGARRRARTWKVEGAEPGTPWPQWLNVRFRGPRGDKLYLVRFELKQGRWVISSWTEREAPGAASGGGARR